MTLRRPLRAAINPRGRTWCIAVGLFLLATCLTSCRTEESIAPGFTEATFLALPIGTSQEEALAKLGEPLERWNHWNPGGLWDAVYWSYRKRTSARATYHAVLVFSRAGKLTSRDLEWYVD